MNAHGLVLAAGRSTRAGTVKALATLEGKSLLERAGLALLEGGCAGLTVVAGDDAARLGAAAPSAKVVKNERVDEGMLTSLQLGVAEASSHGADAVVVSLVDHPHVQAATVKALLARAQRGDATVVVPTFKGTRGHPFVLGRAGFAALKSARAPKKVSDVVAALSSVELPVDDPAVVEDLDTAEELQRAGVHPV
jgi:molybdenum cofactor cytidylyltransferase